MPSRILRDGLLDSERFNRVGLGAQVLYVRLVLVADDFGRYDGRAELVASRCFPLTLAVHGRVAGWLSELATAGLIEGYEEAGKPYLCIPRFNQRLRRQVSKFPEPSGELSDIWRACDRQVTVNGQTGDLVPPKGLPSDSDSDSDSESSSHMTGTGRASDGHLSGMGRTSAGNEVPTNQSEGGNSGGGSPGEPVAGDPRTGDGQVPDTRLPESKRGTRWVAGTVIPEDWLKFAARELHGGKEPENPTVATMQADHEAIEREFANFSDFWLGKPGREGVKIDWFATWRRWVRKWVESRKPRTGRAAPGAEARDWVPPEMRGGGGAA